MKTYCIMAIDENGLASIIQRSAPSHIKTVNLDNTVTAGIYEAFIDETGHCTIDKKLIIPTRGC